MIIIKISVGGNVADFRRSNAGHGIFAMPRRRHISVPCLVEVNLLFPFALCPIYAEFAMQMLEWSTGFRV